MSGRIDILSIFPQFFDVLNLSLIGRARTSEQIELNIHDLRDWATDRHRTVDDSPYGGGAGMVMKPDVWGRGIDEVATGRTQLLIPTPAGTPLTQTLAAQLARDLAADENLIIACGRYEGIDARVAQHYRDQGWPVLEYSLGDYVLNGGEVAAVALVEAVTRLVPGVVGNADSLVEESHTELLLEYPSYTTPASWRELDVPEVLRSGDHGRIQQWRRSQAVTRTARVRPDLLDHHRVEIHPAAKSEAREIAELAALCFPLACPPDFPPEAARGFVADNLSEASFRSYLKDRRRAVLVARVAGVVVGYAMVIDRPPTAGDVVDVLSGRHLTDLSKVYVHPDFHGRSVATALVEKCVEWSRERGAAGLWLGVNALNERARRFYERMGFTLAGQRDFKVGARIERDHVMIREFDGPV